MFNKSIIIFLIVFISLWLFGCGGKKIVKNPDPFAFRDFEKKQKETFKKDFLQFYQSPRAPEIVEYMSFQQENDYAATLFDSVARPGAATIVARVVLDKNGKVLQAEVLHGLSGNAKQQMTEKIKKMKFQPAFLGGDSYASTVLIRFIR